MSYSTKKSSEVQIVNKLIDRKLNKRKDSEVQLKYSPTNATSIRTDHSYNSSLFSKIVNRNELTPLEHLTLLARPKQIIGPSITFHTEFRMQPMPKKKKMLCYDWNDYTITLPIAKLYYLLKDVSMFTNEEMKQFFKNLRESNDIKIKKVTTNKTQNKETKEKPKKSMRKSN